MLVEKFFDENYKSIVVLSNPKTYLNYKFAKKEVKDKVIRADQLIDFIKKSQCFCRSSSFKWRGSKKKSRKLS